MKPDRKLGISWNTFGTVKTQTTPHSKRMAKLNKGMAGDVVTMY
jgi:hypothetical protein